MKISHKKQQKIKLERNQLGKQRVAIHKPRDFSCE